MTDDRGLKDAPVLYYSTEKPEGQPPDLTNLSMVLFEITGKGAVRWRTCPT